jgi:hypothetical protein
MRTKGVMGMLAAVLAVMAVAVPAQAGNNPNGTVFRAVGWFRGESQISDGSITCEIPTAESGIADGAFDMGLWNTLGEAFLYFPDSNSAFGNPCGGFLHLQNNLIDQSIVIQRVEFSYKIPGAKRLRQFVPARNGFPTACRSFRKQRLFVGGVLGPVNSTIDSVSGAPNSLLIKMLPIVNTNVVNCLRSQYGPVPTDVLSSLPLRVTATAVGVSDSGEVYRSNPMPYMLSLRHTCGNGRLDELESCDPTAPVNTCTGFCVIATGESFGFCSRNRGVACQADVDCFGQCLDGNSPSECTCLY